ncbi:uncharacterized protein SCHCODRAFT_01253782 [Schizophyllum commune H4-8]|uniref:uncharacterized protein n=1 Tax=Schizophyllum commune (strain H4-8 / FGSC 9210) TaxID=578458 RepID=UPI00215E9720|nr:uncharacterized protein SCHCODRAFT_01253782 [Schizophyllum commune H4-8]KAI5886474.1 hypothetical protein SCHCODRAFT_01253782 [Schizophyllum commune H4-8]
MLPNTRCLCYEKHVRGLLHLPSRARCASPFALVPPFPICAGAAPASNCASPPPSRASPSPLRHPKLLPTQLRWLDDLTNPTSFTCIGVSYVCQLSDITCEPTRQNLNGLGLLGPMRVPRGKIRRKWRRSWATRGGRDVWRKEDSPFRTYY